jgi:hypothetical protein
VRLSVMVKVSCGIRALLRTVANRIFYAFRGDSNNATSPRRRVRDPRVRQTGAKNVEPKTLLQ